MREHPSGVPAPAAEAGRVLSGPRAFPWAVLLAAAAAGLFEPDWTAAAAPWPFVIALVVFGMPHGAADWAVAARPSGRMGFGTRLAGFAGYLALMAASVGPSCGSPARRRSSSCC